MKNLRSEKNHGHSFKKVAIRCYLELFLVFRAPVGKIVDLNLFPDSNTDAFGWHPAQPTMPALLNEEMRMWLLFYQQELYIWCRPVVVVGATGVTVFGCTQLHSSPTVFSLLLSFEKDAKIIIWGCLLWTAASPAELRESWLTRQSEQKAPIWQYSVFNPKANRETDTLIRERSWLSHWEVGRMQSVALNSWTNSYFYKDAYSSIKRLWYLNVYKYVILLFWRHFFR